MLELLTIVIFVWLLVKTISLAFKLTWSIAKVIASILIGLALPVLVICLVFLGGVALIAPIAVIGIAFGILRACML